jgi:hypothetical protein
VARSRRSCRYRHPVVDLRATQSIGAYANSGCLNPSGPSPRQDQRSARTLLVTVSHDCLARHLWAAGTRSRRKRRNGLTHLVQRRAQVDLELERLRVTATERRVGGGTSQNTTSAAVPATVKQSRYGFMQIHAGFMRYCPQSASRIARTLTPSRSCLPPGRCPILPPAAAFARQTEQSRTRRSGWRSRPAQRHRHHPLLPGVWKTRTSSAAPDM